MMNSEAVSKRTEIRYQHAARGLKEYDSKKICLKILGQRTLLADASSCKYNLHRVCVMV